jgi:hypothetical protein
MVRRAAVMVGFALLLLMSSTGWTQTEFDPETVELDEEPAEPVEPAEADPPPTPATPPTAETDPQPTTSTPPPPRAEPARRATTRSRSRAQRRVVERAGPEIPAALQPWVAWALHDTPDLVCPDVNGVRVCRWPGTLRFTAGAQGGSFAFDVYADRPTEFALPGNRDAWPQEVRLDGAAPPVLAIGDVPGVLVPAGTHRITGQFYWSEAPEVISVPPDVGNVELTVGGRAIARPRVDGEARLWLGDGTSDGGEEAETDSVRASVYRKFLDGVPLTIITRVRLNVSGRAREVDLGAILLTDSLPVAVRAQIPVQVGADGSAKAYVRPGTHDIEIEAVIPQRAEKLLAPRPASNFYDAQEIWVWVPDEMVRSVELGGLTAVDPERTSLPPEWRGHTTFLADPGTGLDLIVTRRGIVETQPNVINLNRDLWLDLDGEGYTIRDRIEGTLHQSWRLDYTPTGEARLGRVMQSGENLLITEAPGSELTGVELRNPTVDLEAEIRVEKSRANLAIVGWNHDVQSLSAQLHLPPGWTLLGGHGVDRMKGTWIESWTLWDFFFVLMVAIVIGRLFGWQWAGVALLALSLAHGERDAPRWIWIHLIATLALLRVLPRGWWRKAIVGYRWVAIIAFVVIMAPFVHDQVVVAFHPQVSAAQPHSSRFDFSGAQDRHIQQRLEPAAPMQEQEQVASQIDIITGEDSPVARDSKRLAVKKGYGKSDWKDLQQVDPNAVVQTGPGLPNWTWSTWNLEWTGPVGKDHTIELWLVSPTLNTVLGLMRVILLIFLGLLLLAPRDMYWERRRPVPNWWRRLFGTGLPIVFATFVFASVEQPRAIAAEVPSEQTLQQLRERIASASQCPSPCVVASDASIAVNGLDFELSADVSAASDTAWTLPGPTDALRIEAVVIDGATTNQLRRVDGLVQVRLEAGNHEVVVRGTLADRNTVTIQFDNATRPRHVSFDSADWAIDGISPTGVPDNSLQLTRTIDSQIPDADRGRAEHAELPPWYEVERRVGLGMPWQLETTVRRIDTSRPQLVKLPLVGGEKVITEGIRVENGYVLVDFARDQDAVVYVAELPIDTQVELTAALNQPWTETWVVECSRIWRCTFSDLPQVATIEGSQWQPRWKPWPGESLVITVDKPLGAAGEPKTVENVRYDVTPGKRLMQATLTFTIRASQGDWQEITLPADASLQSVSIDRKERSIRPRDGVVRLPVQPGETAYTLQWQQPWERSTTERVPEVRLGSAAANVETTINLGTDRWLLVVRNDEMPWGPAVLFWWSLLLVGLVAVMLGAIPNVPLKWWEWGLLAVGMSQLPILAMLPVVFWFVVLSWRARDPLTSWWRFDLLQLTILVLTLMAIGAMYGAAHTNLVLNIDMQVDGYGSTNQMLRWYSDRVVDTLPTPAIVSVPELVFRGISFLWALWAVVLIVRSARWGWRAFSVDGWWKFPTPRPPKQTPHKRDWRTVNRDEEIDDDPTPSPSKPPPPPVPRNSRDGQVVHVEIELGSSPPRTAFNIGEVDTEPVHDGEEASPPEAIGEVGDLTTDDVIGALVDDSDVLGEEASSEPIDLDEDRRKDDSEEE